MHRPIKRFEQTGQIYDDRYFLRVKEENIKMLVLMMRYQGYVPRFDIDPDWSISYDGKNYDFKLSVYGVYVGKRKAQCIQGKAGNLEVPFTQRVKSQMHSHSQE